MKMLETELGDLLYLLTDRHCAEHPHGADALKRAAHAWRWTARFGHPVGALLVSLARANVRT